MSGCRSLQACAAAIDIAYGKARVADERVQRTISRFNGVKFFIDAQTFPAADCAAGYVTSITVRRAKADGLNAVEPSRSDDRKNLIIRRSCRRRRATILK